MAFAQRRLRSVTLWLVSSLYVTWALVFIWRSSIVASDKHRYFCLFDDAMISMRYAWNLAHGKGCCWNPGEYVQGFTTPLMVGLMALPSLLLSKSAACLAVQLFAIPTVFGSAHYARRLCEFISDSFWLPTITFVAVLAYYPLSYWSLMGMETGVVCLCMSAAAYHAVRQDTFRSLIAMCLGFLARPDFLVVAALLLTFLFFVDQRRAMVSAAAFAAFVLLVFAGQFIYYNDPLPNTYTLKLHGFPLLVRLRRGAGFIAPFLAETVALLSLAVAGVASLATCRRRLLLLVCCAVIAYQIYVGGDPWPYWRMLTPMMPILFALAVVGAHAVVGRKVLVTAVAVLLSTLLGDAQFLPEMTFGKPPYKTDENRDNLNQAILLNRLLRPGSSIGVQFAGVLPYYTEFRAIDFLGKTDRTIARLPLDAAALADWSDRQTSLPGHSKYNLNYSIGELKPDFIQTYRYGHSDTSSWIEQFYEWREIDGIEIIVRKGSIP